MRVGSSSFRGEVPLLTPRALPDNASQDAVNARLESGDLEAWRRPLQVKALATDESGPVETIFLLGGQWLSWQQQVEVARGIIPGDTTMRTYITGLDVPRWTTFALATTGAEPFPVITRPIGVPAPEVAPTIEVLPPAVVTGDVEILNPGAELGSLDWISPTGGELGDHDNTSVPGFIAYAGTHFWYGGSIAATTAYQDIDLVAAEVIEGQTLALTWQQASGANGGKVGLAIQFYDVDDGLVGDEVASSVIAITPALTWKERTFSCQVPADAVVARIVQTYQRVGGTELDGFVDAIRIDKLQYSLSWDGSSTSGWTVSPDGGPSANRSKWLRIDAAFGQPAPSFQFDMDSRAPFMWQSLNTDASPALVLQYDVFATERAMAGIYCTDAGVGTHLAIVQNLTSGGSIVSTEIYTEYHLQWEVANGNKITSLYTGNFSQRWLTVTLTANVASSSKARVTVRVVDKADGTVYVDDETIDWDIDGGALGFSAYATERSRETWLDNIQLQLSPPETEAAETTLYTSYVLTFVNDIGEESAPSDASLTVQRNANSSVVITMPTTAPTGIDEYGIVQKRLYRAATGATGTAFRFVVELDLDVPTFADNLPDAELGDVLESEEWELPPDDLRNILALPNGIMVGSSGNQLCFSVSGHPHAWPVAYRLPTDTDIVGLGNVDTTVFIGTQSFVYTASGNAPGSYSMSKPGAPHACTSRRSIAYVIGQGVYFAGPDGIMVSAGPTQVANATENMFTRDQWQALDPTSILGIAHDNTYFFFWDDGSEVGGYALEPGPNGFGLIKLGMHASAAYADPMTDKLYVVLDVYEEPSDVLLPPVTGDAGLVVDGHKVYHFNGGVQPMLYRWLSKLHLLPGRGAFQMARVRAGDYAALVLRIYSDGALLMEKLIENSRPFTLPMGSDYESVEYELIGTSRARTVQLVSDVQEFD